MTDVLNPEQPVLKHCPFCDEHPRVYADAVDDHEVRFYVGCPACKSRGSKKLAFEAAISSWNKRVT